MPGNEPFDDSTTASMPAITNADLLEHLDDDELRGMLYTVLADVMDLHTLLPNSFQKTRTSIITPAESDLNIWEIRTDISDIDEGEALPIWFGDKEPAKTYTREPDYDNPLTTLHHRDYHFTKDELIDRFGDALVEVMQDQLSETQEFDPTILPDTLLAEGAFTELANGDYTYLQSKVLREYILRTLQEHHPTLSDNNAAPVTITVNRHHTRDSDKKDSFSISLLSPNSDLLDRIGGNRLYLGDTLGDSKVFRLQDGNRILTSVTLDNLEPVISELDRIAHEMGEQNLL